MPVSFAEFNDPVPLAAGRAALAAQISQAALLAAEADASCGALPAAASRLCEADGPRIYPLRASWDGATMPPRRIIDLRLHDAAWRLALEAAPGGYVAVAVHAMDGTDRGKVPDIWQGQVALALGAG